MYVEPGDLVLIRSDWQVRNIESDLELESCFMYCFVVTKAASLKKGVSFEGMACMILWVRRPSQVKIWSEHRRLGKNSVADIVNTGLGRPYLKAANRNLLGCLPMKYKDILGVPHLEETMKNYTHLLEGDLK